MDCKLIKNDNNSAFLCFVRLFKATSISSALNGWAVLGLEEQKLGMGEPKENLIWENDLPPTHPPPPASNRSLPPRVLSLASNCCEVCQCVPWEYCGSWCCACGPPPAASLSKDLPRPPPWCQRGRTPGCSLCNTPHCGCSGEGGVAGETETKKNTNKTDLSRKNTLFHNSGK